MTIAASFTAMNTTHAHLGGRTREIATLRALGYSRASILLVARAGVMPGVVGVLGGLLSAIQARRPEITEALRDA